MKTLTIELPESENEQDFKIRLAGFLMENGFYTYGQAAALAGLPKREFLETIGRYGFSIFSGDLHDIVKPMQDDLNVEAMKKVKRYAGINRQELDSIAARMNIQEPYEELVRSIGK